MPRDGLPEPKRKTTSLTGLVRSRATTPRTQCGRFVKWIAKRSRSIEMGLNALSLAQPLPSMPTDHTRSKASSQRTSPSGQITAYRTR
jgi:hypothetical protein